MWPVLTQIVDNFIPYYRYVLRKFDYAFRYLDICAFG